MYKTIITITPYKNESADLIREFAKKHGIPKYRIDELWVKHEGVLYKFFYTMRVGHKPDLSQYEDYKVLTGEQFRKEFLD